MNLTQALDICSSLPFMGCVVGTLFLLFTSYGSTSPSDSSLLTDEVNDHQAAARNRAARSISSKFNMSAELSQIFLAQLSLVEDSLAASAVVHAILVNWPCNLVFIHFCACSLFLIT
ncbi:hypothetical protein D5086_008402 [Populus alba]|uniref:Uncharacterized protein n=1 Tax=Populus alba TaxID=43335 RepID=A0ACC4CFI2_POPAL